MNFFCENVVEFYNIRRKETKKQWKFMCPTYRSCEHPDF